MSGAGSGAVVGCRKGRAELELEGDGGLERRRGGMGAWEGGGVSAQLMGGRGIGSVWAERLSYVGLLHAVSAAPWPLLASPSPPSPSVCPPPPEQWQTQTSSPRKRSLARPPPTSAPAPPTTPTRPRSIQTPRPPPSAHARPSTASPAETASSSATGESPPPLCAPWWPRACAHPLVRRSPIIRNRPCLSCVQRSAAHSLAPPHALHSRLRSDSQAPPPTATRTRTCRPRTPARTSSSPSSLPALPPPPPL